MISPAPVPATDAHAKPGGLALGRLLRFLAPVKGKTLLALLIFTASIGAETLGVYYLRTPINLMQQLAGESDVRADHFWTWLLTGTGLVAQLRHALLLVILALLLILFLWPWLQSTFYSWQA